MGAPNPRYLKDHTCLIIHGHHLQYKVYILRSSFFLALINFGRDQCINSTQCTSILHFISFAIDMLYIE